MERLIQMKEQLISAIQGQMTNLKDTNTKELGEAIDMVKDLSEAIYYCTVTKAMEEHSENQKMPMSENNNYYYTEKYCL